MNGNDLTIGQAKDLAKFFTKTDKQAKTFIYAFLYGADVYDYMEGYRGIKR